MDDRLRFLYCVAAELWGRMRVPMGRGMEAPAQAGEGRGEGKSPRRGRAGDAERSIVAKHGQGVPRKAAIARHAPVP